MANQSSHKQDLIERIDALLAVPAVAADEQERFLNDWGVMLERVVLFSEDQPTAALEVLWHYLDRLPAVFAKVTDRDGLADLCTFLAEDTLRVAVREREHLAETIGRLRAVREAHRTSGDPFYAVPGVLANPKLPAWVRTLINRREDAVS
jgi:hypothetical protein